jgi:predicted ATPase
MKDVSKFAIRSVLANLPKTGEQLLEFGGSDGRISAATILIGRNGSGKSTLLRELCTALRVPSKRRDRYIRLRSISFEADGVIYHRMQDPHDGLRANSDNASTSSFPAPRRIIALSFTPFDKFPVRDDMFDYRFPIGPHVDRGKPSIQEVDPAYVYLGFKTGVRLSSPTRRLMNSLDDLAFQDTSSHSDERIAGVLDAIGYKPTIRLRYRLSRQLNSDITRGLDISPVRRRVLERYSYDRLLELDRGPGGIRYTLDFGRGFHESDAGLGYQGIRELVRESILFIDSVLLTPRGSGEPIELLELSSGELNLLSGFLGLAAYLKDGSLILIDEPENSLHPEWQLRYVSMLDAVIRRHNGCHYVIATHSPLIVSGVADQGATVLRLDQSPAEIDGAQVADSSPDATLVKAFDVVTPGNSFIREIVLEAMTLIETDRTADKRAQEISAILIHAYKDIGPEDPIKPLVGAVVKAIAGSETRAS